MIMREVKSNAIGRLLRHRTMVSNVVVATDH